MKQYWVPVLIVLIVATAVGWWNWGRTSAPSSDPIPEFTGLDETKQKEIWDAEHATFEIETHVGRKLVAALQSRKTDQLARFFRPGFEGNIPGRSHPTTIDKSSITETVNRAESADVANVDADGLIQFLITGTVRINKIQRGRFRVLKIARDEGEGNEDEWRLSVLLTVGGINSEGRPITYD
ncbi:MAG: hypothetical protein HON53_07535, partial [Planctomycetaceae bacterium]|nr:hypothetical protein [Planctomycetaceae bacterium]